MNATSVFNLIKRWVWPQRLHHQLVLMVSMALLLALGLLGGYTASEQASIALRAHEAQANSMARNVAIASGNPILTDSLDQLEELVLRAADFDEVTSLRVINAEGRTLSHVIRGKSNASRLQFDRPAKMEVLPTRDEPIIVTEEALGQITVWYPIKTHQLIGWVQLGYTAEVLSNLRLSIWRNTLVVAVMAVTFCAALLALFLRTPMQALNDARQFATALIEADGRQMPIQSGPVEVVELGAALNEASMLLRQQMLLIEDGLQQLKTHEAQLAEQNDQLGAIFALSADGLVTFGKTGRVLFANQAFMNLTGLKPSQVIGQQDAQLDAQLLALAAQGSSYAGLDACFRQPGEQEGAKAQILMVSSAHKAVLSLSGQHSASRSVSRILYVCDVTKQYTLDQMKTEFLSMAAHELRTPMVSILGFTELMLTRDLKEDVRKNVLNSVYRQSQSMSAILNELLDLARIEARRGQDFKLETADLADVVIQVMADFKPPLGRDLPLIDEPMLPMPVHVDIHKMQQALLNILSNAYKYSPDGGPVYVRYLIADAEQGRHRFAVEIEDQGLGLSAENLARLGERFFRVDKSGNIPGTGLGISIVKELIELMGGRMQVSSELGKGTTVTLWL
jgi:two-component system sensor histidine kinase VicK